MNRLTLTVVLSLLSILLVGCGPSDAEKKERIAKVAHAEIKESERIEAEEFGGRPKTPRETWEKAVNSYFDKVQGAAGPLMYNPDARAFRLRGEFSIKVSNVNFKKFGDASLSGRLTIVWKDHALPKISEEVACFTSALENPCIASLKVPHLRLFRRKLTKGNVLSDVRVMTYQILEVEKTSGDINEVHSYYYPELELPAKLSDPITVYLKSEN